MLLSRIAHYILGLLTSTSQLLPGSDANTRQDLLSEDLRSYIHWLRERWDVTGLVATVVASPNYTRAGGISKGRAEYAGGGWVTETIVSGNANSAGAPVTSQSLFAIASNSKLFTALAVGMLIEDGTTLPNGQMLSWSSKMKDVLPGWGLMDTYAQEHLELLDLLSMRSGLPRHDGAIHFGSVAEHLPRLAHMRPSVEIRQAFQYNNHHYYIMPLVFSHLANTTIMDFVQRRIFDPLGLGAMYNFSQVVETGLMTESFTRNWRNETVCRLVGGKAYDVRCIGKPTGLGYWTEGDNYIFAGAGGIVMDVSDMAKWIRELLSPQVIPRNVVKKVTTGYTVENATPDFPEESVFAYGLGQEIVSYRGHRVNAHSGGLPGQASWLMWLPDHGFGVMLAANDDDVGAIMGTLLAHKVMDDMLGLPSIDWESRFLPKINSAGQLPHVPEKPRPSPSFAVGTYADPAYGNITVQRYDPAATELDVPTILAASGGSLNASKEILFADFFCPFTSHLIFSHYDGPIYNATALKLYPLGSAGASTPASTMAAKTPAVWGAGQLAGQAVFTENGVGFFGGFWGAGRTVQSRVVTEERTEDEAEVWFKRV